MTSYVSGVSLLAFAPTSISQCKSMRNRWVGRRKEALLLPTQIPVSQMDAELYNVTCQAVLMHPEPRRGGTRREKSEKAFLRFGILKAVEAS